MECAGRDGQPLLAAKVAPTMLQRIDKVSLMQFDMMESEQMVQDMICVYNKNTREFHTIVRVGRDVCGCAPPSLCITSDHHNIACR